VDVKWGKNLENSDVGTVIAMDKMQFSLHTSRRALEAGKDQSTAASVRSAESRASSHRSGPSKKMKGDAESRVASEGDKKGKGGKGLKGMASKRASAILDTGGMPKLTKATGQR